MASGPASLSLDDKPARASLSRPRLVARAGASSRSASNRPSSRAFRRASASLAAAAAHWASMGAAAAVGAALSKRLRRLIIQVLPPKEAAPRRALLHTHAQ